jgi:hypothetical protein
VGPFVMAMVMANCVRRSNALLCYGPKLSYYEAARFPNFAAAFVNMFGLILFGTALSCPPLAWLLRTCCLPSPGQGEPPLLAHSWSQPHGAILLSTSLICSNLTAARPCFVAMTGPSESTMDKGFLRVTVAGEGVQGTTAKCSFYFPTDPVRAALASFSVSSLMQL